MVLKKAAVGIAVAVLSALPLAAQTLPDGAVRLAAETQKAVPRVDKSSVEVIGTVQQVFTRTECGVTGTLVVLNVKGVFPTGGVPVTGVCAGPLSRACKNLKVGSRMRFQGVMTPFPDPTQDGFDVCDPNTWQYFTILQSFTVTKILK